MEGEKRRGSERGDGEVEKESDVSLTGGSGVKGEEGRDVEGGIEVFPLIFSIFTSSSL